MRISSYAHPEFFPKLIEKKNPPASATDSCVFYVNATKSYFIISLCTPLYLMQILLQL